MIKLFSLKGYKGRFIVPLPKLKVLKGKISNISKDKFYGINFNKVFLDRATENIINDPIRYLTLFTKKFMSFLFIDIHSSRQDYYKPLHYLPVLVLAITLIF